MEGNIIRKVLVIGIIFLFIGVGIQPAFADENIIMSNIKKEDNVNPKEYLFRTIIDIANNPDVKNLLEQYKNDWEYNNCFAKFDIDRSVYRKIFFRTPRLIFSMFVTKPSLTYKYLDNSYNIGCELKNILGEKEINDIVSSFEITNQEIFNEVNNIIINNEALYDKIIILSEINKIFITGAKSDDFPIICEFLLIVSLLNLFISLFFEAYGFGIFSWIFYFIAVSFAVISNILDCPPWSFP
jgi:hypothetical protein